MKFLAICFTIALFAAAQGVTDEQKERSNKIRAECMEKTGVTEEMIEKIHKGEVVDNPKMRAHSLCICIKAGVMCDCGKIHKDVLKTKLINVAGEGHEEEVNKVVEECATLQSTPEDTAFHLLKCVHQHYKAKDFYITN